MKIGRIGQSAAKRLIIAVKQDMTKVQRLGISRTFKRMEMGSSLLNYLGGLPLVHYILLQGNYMRKFRDTPYFINEMGEVFREGKNAPLKPDTSSKGYSRVTLCIGGKTERFLVHRMVAEVYLSKKDGDTEVNHIDCNPSNNVVSNLEWCTKSGNQLHALRLGRCPNLLASRQASANKAIQTQEQFRTLLGDFFIEVINKKPRNFIKFYCSACNNAHECRTDSSLFTRQPIVCAKCA